MVGRHHVEGYENFCKFVEGLKTSNDTYYFFFSGNKLPNGESWCPDCVEALPVVENALKNADENSHFVYVEVGDRPTWKDMNCSFRKDSRTKLMVIPTLIKWGSPIKLEGEQCAKADLVELVFNEED